MALAPVSRRGPTLALLAARVVYAFNWYNVGAVVPLFGADLHADAAAAGAVLGAFLLGVGLFQVPAGVAAVRWGPRNVSIIGLAVLGAAALASAFAPSWPILAATRFVAGVGAAFFFSPALSLIASYFPPGHRGPIIGLYNGGFSLGGTIGLFGGAIIGGLAGWPTALAVGGVAMLASTVSCAVVLPSEPTGRAVRSSQEVWVTTVGILRSRSIWALSLGLTGFWGATYAVAQFFVDYGAEVHPEWPAGGAAALAAAFVLVSLPGGPLGGWIGDRTRHRRRLLIVLGAATAALTATIPFGSFAEVGAVLLALGLLDGMIFAILYLEPTYLPETRGEGLAIGVAVINSIQVGLGSGTALLFGAVAARSGFVSAWWIAAALAVALLPILAIPPHRAVPSRSRTGDVGDGTSAAFHPGTEGARLRSEIAGTGVPVGGPGADPTFL